MARQFNKLANATSTLVQFDCPAMCTVTTTLATAYSRHLNAPTKNAQQRSTTTNPPSPKMATSSSPLLGIPTTTFGTSTLLTCGNHNDRPTPMQQPPWDEFLAVKQLQIKWHGVMHRWDHPPNHRYNEPSTWITSTGQASIHPPFVSTAQKRKQPTSATHKTNAKESVRIPMIPNNFHLSNQHLHGHLDLCQHHLRSNIKLRVQQKTAKQATQSTTTTTTTTTTLSTWAASTAQPANSPHDNHPPLHQPH